ncbi:DNA-processing protein DprA [Piscirickettsia litoralis]|uniref:DNA protecting protein DprA n=1 Tax=Piscirickettsia litoralis TaxID=1891921 RepID=A0ABX3A2A4_9GAMM|nr:DNA-processing protein DprA [Piscirickettsia litoralis]ODN43009.1 DNA protecting protein DprA [Piscirickettsia litoralis]
MNQEQAACIALYHTRHIGPQRLYRLLDHFQTASNIVNADLQQLQSVNLSKQLISAILKPNWRMADKVATWVLEPDHHVVFFNEPSYPTLLKQINTPPALLYIVGDIQLLNKPQLAMVGTRKPTPSGQEAAYQFAYEAVYNQLCITSGLAIGIDTISHQTAIDNQGKTIAVLGCGVDVIYPSQNKKLYQDIREQGAIVSEFALGAQPTARHFPQRNRIIAGLSSGTLVVEAAVKSGSLITAQYALDANRDVFAIPGSIYNEQAQGCHSLIKQGATLVESFSDIADNFNFNHFNSVTSGPSRIQPKAALKTVKSHHTTQENQLPQQSALDLTEIDPTSICVLEHLGFEATAIDQLVERTGLAAEVISSSLLNLELDGRVSTIPGGYIRTKGKRL